MDGLRIFARALTSPLALRELPAATWRWLGLYLLAGGALIAIAVTAWVAMEDAVGDAVAAYVLPESWVSIGRFVWRRLLRAQTKALSVNALVALGGLAASLLLFRLKARISSTYEEGRALVADAPSPLRLRTELFDEVKLALAFVAAQGGLFWLGYFDVPWMRVTATVLSYGLLFATWAINFTAPLFLRHGGYYSHTAKVLARHPLSSLLFGALFSMPVVVAGLAYKAHPEWPRTTAVTALLGATLLCTALAQAAGTRYGAALFDHFRASSRASWPARLSAWVVVGALLGGSGWLFTKVALSVHHKSQLLKLDYAVDLGSARFDLPRLGDLLSSKVGFGVSLEVTIRNPTRFDVELERNRIEVTHAEERVATTRLSPFRVPAGAERKERIAFHASVDPSIVLKGTALFRSGWRITLYVALGYGFELPVYWLR